MKKIDCCLEIKIGEAKIEWCKENVEIIKRKIEENINSDVAIQKVLEDDGRNEDKNTYSFVAYSGYFTLDINNMGIKMFVNEKVKQSVPELADISEIFIIILKTIFEEYVDDMIIEKTKYESIFLNDEEHNINNNYLKTFRNINTNIRIFNKQKEVNYVFEIETNQRYTMKDILLLLIDFREEEKNS